MLLIVLVSGVFWDLCSAFLSRACLSFGGRDTTKKRKILKNIKAAQGKRLSPAAGPIFGPLSARSIEGFHFEEGLISRFYFVMMIAFITALGEIM